MSDIKEIGCCGAYYEMCREFCKTCIGCKLGYLDSLRDLSRAKCKMKECCLAKRHIACGDCLDYECCDTIRSFLNHDGYKYRKYMQSLKFIRAYGYCAFLEAAQNGMNAYSKFPEQKT